MSIYYSGDSLSGEEWNEINDKAKEYLVAKGAEFEDYEDFKSTGMPYVQLDNALDWSNVNVEDFKGCIVFKKGSQLNSYWTSPFPHDICRLTIVKTKDSIGKIILGRNTILSGTSIVSYGCVEIGDDVLFGPNVIIMDNDGHIIDRKKAVLEGDRPGAIRPVKIGRGAWLGYGSMIMKGVTVGEYAVVAANSVVTRDVPPRTVVAGNPARIIKTIED